MKFTKFDLDDEAFNAELDDLPAEIRAQFEALVEAHESTKPVVLSDALSDVGYGVMSPERLDNAAIGEELHRLIEALALLQIYVENTDHLSDRELYEKLVNDLLREEYVIFPGNPRASLHLDILGSYGPEETELYLRYFADDESRARWAEDYGATLPPRERPPFDRDRRLPKRDWGAEPIEH